MKKAGWRNGKQSWVCVIRRAVSAARYRKSPKGKATHTRHRQSPGGKASYARYRESPEGRASYDRYDNSPKRSAAREREYLKTLDVRIANKTARVAELEAILEELLKEE